MVSGGHYLKSDYKMADTLYEHIEEFLKTEEQQLDEEEQLLVTYYLQNGHELVVTGFGYHNPTLIYIYGKLLGEDVTVLVSMGKVELVVRKVKPGRSERKSQIGFLGTRQTT